MQLARLASSKQQLAPQGPFRPPGQQGSQIEKKNVTTLSGMGFRNFLGYRVFFLVGPPPVGNGDLVVFWPVLGRGHLEKFRARAGKRKTQFPVARGPKTELFYRVVRHGCPQLAYSLRFDQLDAHGRENTKYEDVGPFGPRRAVGT